MKGISLLLLALLFSTSAQAEATSSVIFLHCKGSGLLWLGENSPVSEEYDKILRIEERPNGQNYWGYWDKEHGQFVTQIFHDRGDRVNISPLNISSHSFYVRRSSEFSAEHVIDRRTGQLKGKSSVTALGVKSSMANINRRELTAQCEPTAEPQPENTLF